MSHFGHFAHEHQHTQRSWTVYIQRCNKHVNTKADPMQMYVCVCASTYTLHVIIKSGALFSHFNRSHAASRLPKASPAFQRHQIFKDLACSVCIHLYPCVNYCISPHLCVGFLFLVLYSRPRRPPPPPAASHTLLTHNSPTHNSPTYNLLTHNSLTPTHPHTTYPPTTYSHTYSHTTYSHTHTHN